MTRCWHVGQTDSGSRSNHRAMLRKALRQGGPLHAAEAMLQAAIRLLRPQRPMGLSSFGDAFLARLLLCPLRLTHTPRRAGPPARRVAGPSWPKECSSASCGLSGRRGAGVIRGFASPEHPPAEIPLPDLSARHELPRGSRLTMLGGGEAAEAAGRTGKASRPAWPGGHAAALPGASCQASPAILGRPRRTRGGPVRA